MLGFIIICTYLFFFNETYFITTFLFLSIFHYKIYFIILLIFQWKTFNFTCRHFAFMFFFKLAFHVSISFFEINKTHGTKVGRNVSWVVLSIIRNFRFFWKFINMLILPSDWQKYLHVWWNYNMVGIFLAWPSTKF